MIESKPCVVIIQSNEPFEFIAREPAFNESQRMSMMVKVVIKAVTQVLYYRDRAGLHSQPSCASYRYMTCIASFANVIPSLHKEQQISRFHLR